MKDFFKLVSPITSFGWKDYNRNWDAIGYFKENSGYPFDFAESKKEGSDCELTVS